MADMNRMSADVSLGERPRGVHVRSDPEVRLASLYEAHAAQVGRYAARRVPAQDVPDVIAETFLTAWRRLRDVPDDALPWLLGTARRHISNRRRSARRRNALGTKLAEAHVPAAPEELATIDEALLAAIRRLPSAEREAFMLVAWDGLEPARAAAAARCSRTAFRVRLHRARTRLRNDLSRSHVHDARTTTVKREMEEAR